MARAEAKIENGTLKGWECEFGHIHVDQPSAMSCDPNKFAGETKAKQVEAEKQRVAAIRNEDLYDKAIAAVIELGGAKDKKEAEPVVLKHGTKRVIEVRDAVRSLEIAKDEDDDEEKDDGKSANGKPGKPAGVPPPPPSK